MHSFAMPMKFKFERGGSVTMQSKPFLSQAYTDIDKCKFFMESGTGGGIRRFRPIALTSATTYLGLLPLMFEASPPAMPLIPMAISLGYGVLYASIMTLFMVPCGYVILDDWAHLLGRRPGHGPELREPGDDAEVVPISDNLEIAASRNH